MENKINQQLEEIKKQNTQIDNQSNSIKNKDSLIKYKEEIMDQLEEKAISCEDIQKQLHIEIEDDQQLLIDAINNMKNDLVAKQIKIDGLQLQKAENEAHIIELEQHIQDQVNELSHFKKQKQLEIDELIQQISDLKSSVFNLNTCISGKNEEIKVELNDIENLVFYYQIYLLSQEKIIREGEQGKQNEYKYYLIVKGRKLFYKFQQVLEEKIQEIDQLKLFEKENGFLNDKILKLNKTILHLEEKEKELLEVKKVNRKLQQIENKLSQKEKDNEDLKNKLKESNSSRKQIDKELKIKCKDLELSIQNYEKLEEKQRSLVEKYKQKKRESIPTEGKDDLLQVLFNNKLYQKWVGKMKENYKAQKGISEYEIVIMTDKLIRNLSLDNGATSKPRDI